MNFTTMFTTIINKSIKVNVQLILKDEMINISITEIKLISQNNFLLKKVIKAEEIEQIREKVIMNMCAKIQEVCKNK